MSTQSQLSPVAECFKQLFARPLPGLHGIVRIDYFSSPDGNHGLFLRMHREVTAELLTAHSHTYPNWVFYNTRHVWERVRFGLSKHRIGLGLSEIQALLGVSHRLADYGITYEGRFMRVPHSNFFRCTVKYTEAQPQPDPFAGLLLRHEQQLPFGWNKLLIAHAPVGNHNYADAELQRLWRITYGYNIAGVPDERAFNTWLRITDKAQTLCAF